MSQPLHSHLPDRTIPIANCIRCKVGMRLTAVEPTNRLGVERLIFECTCGDEIRLPVTRHEAER